MRIVSVLPSATEIVCALGARGELVGRSAECDYPPHVGAIPVVMRPRTLDRDRSSAEIDARVRAARAEGESLYVLDVECLRAARPDVLITQDLCGVCSVTGDEVAQACVAAGVRPRILALAPRTLGEVWDSIETVGDAIGRPDAARRLATDARRRSSPARSTTTTVAIVEWLGPPILAGLWAPEMVGAAGARALGPPAGAAGEATSWEQLEALRPDLLVLSPCSFSVERARRELRSPTLDRRLRSIGAPLGTFVADEAYFSRPGPRLADGVELLGTLLRADEPHGPMPVVRWVPGVPEVAA